MKPSELMASISEGLRFQREHVGEGAERWRFQGIYKDYYLMDDEDGFICLCVEKYGYLLKVNRRGNLHKATMVIYYWMTTKQ